MGSRCRSEIAAAGGAQKRHPQNKKISKMGSSYLGKNEEWIKSEREDSSLEEGAWAMRFKPP